MQSTSMCGPVEPRPGKGSASGIQQGKRCDLSVGEGNRILRECMERATGGLHVPDPRLVAENFARYGAAVEVRPRYTARFGTESRPPSLHRAARCVVLGRVRSAATPAPCVLASRVPGTSCRRNPVPKRASGQGLFSLAVRDAYHGACAVTGEHSLPALEAAHILPYGQGGEHRVDNGLLLRSDLHRLYDRGYVTVTPDYVFRVSDRLRDEFQNGRSYYGLDGAKIAVPSVQALWPRRELLERHTEEVYRG